MRVNRAIRSPEVRVIGTDGTQLGILPISEALETAAEQGLDLVEVSPNSTPPVCRIIDYGKYKYQEKKRLQESKKNRTVIQVKEITLRPKTDTHDLNVKINHLKKFLAGGKKTKVTVRFRGREIIHSEISRGILDNIAKATEELGVIEQSPKMEGRCMSMMLAPKAKAT